eukprot:TRINITY_DN1585_c0_g1_i1.p1 TRINITY_DN1585_c0_g1~~TRINITY_DN1585_c0_g1_i1.p1  ORF type:complete len:634 (+),score=224.40 TRINITY_DN1585_c0_g1_i1:803-2704(+)
MLLQLVWLAGSAGYFSGLGFNRDIQDYLLTRALKVESEEGCLSGPVALGVDVDHLSPTTCKNAALDAELLYMVVGWGDACWGSNTLRNWTGPGEGCGKVWKVLKYARGFSKGVPPPRPLKANPLTIWVSAVVTKLNSIDIRQQSYSYSMNFRDEWLDPRLVWDPADFNNQEWYNWSSSSNDDFRRFVWAPDTLNNKALDIQNPETDEAFAIRYDGYMARSRFLVVSAVCEMNLQFYPFDYQECITDITSHSYDASELQMAASPNYTGLMLDENPSACSVCRVNTVRAYKLVAPSYHAITKNYGGLDFVGVRWVLIFSRASYWTYLLIMFLPLWLICVLSMGSCWIDTDATTARVGMGITTVLVLISQINGLKEVIPDTRYVTSLDVYLLLCLVFVTANCVEFGVANYLMNRLEQADANMKLRSQCVKTRLEDLQKLQGGIDANDENSPEYKCFGAKKFNFENTGDASTSGSTEPVVVEPKLDYVSTPVKRMKKNTKPTKRESAFLKEVFSLFVEAEDYVSDDDDEEPTISVAKISPLMSVYFGVPDEHVLRLIRDQHHSTRITYRQLEREIHRLKIMKIYGVRAITVWNHEITMTTIHAFETGYRKGSIIVFLVYNVVWFATVMGIATFQRGD